MDREGSVAGPHDTHNRQAEGMQVWWGEKIKITMPTLKDQLVGQWIFPCGIINEIIIYFINLMQYTTGNRQLWSHQPPFFFGYTVVIKVAGRPLHELKC